MQFITNLIGDQGTTLLTTIFALGIVLVLIVLGLWVLKLTVKTSAAVGRGRNRRLSIVEQLQVDPRRQLLIIRRDDVEHVILTGGTQDVVVETGIAVERPAPAARRPTGPSDTAVETPVPTAPARQNLDKLKDMARPAAFRKPTSLRHTGLLRPVSAMEPAIIPLPPMAGDNSGRGKADSATTPAGSGDNGRSGFGAARDLGNGRKADAP